MIGGCPTAIAPDSLARDVLASADCLIADQIQQGYAALLAPGGPVATALTVAATIYVATVGYRLALGLTSLTLGEIVPHFIKLGLVFALATSWPSYQTLVFNTLFDGPEQLATVALRQAATAPAATAADVLTGLQQVFTRLTDAADDAWGQKPVTPPVARSATPPTAPAPPITGAPATVALPPLGAPQFVAALLWLSALVLMAASVGVLLVVRIVLALLLLLGPVFVAFALFRSTRGVAEGWLRVAVKFALVPLFMLPLIAVAVAILGPLAAQLDAAPIVSVRNGPVLLIVLVVLVFAAVIGQAARLGGGIAGSIRLPRRAAPGAAEPPSFHLAAAAVSAPPALSRAETIVQAIESGHGQPSYGSAAAPAVIAALRTIAGPAVAPSAAIDASGRLGQGYRRLALGYTSSAARPRT